MGRLQRILIPGFILITGSLILAGLISRDFNSRANASPFTGDFIYIQPLGQIEMDKMAILEDIVRGEFTKEVRMLPMKPLPGRFLVEDRNQYDANKIMSWARGMVPNDAFRYLVIIEKDMFSGRFNFIFGQADVNGKVCTISINRFANSARPLRGLERPLFRLRLKKLIVHELGHTLGLTHCYHRNCVMHFATNLRQMDLQSRRFCQSCLDKLQKTSLIGVLSHTGDALTNAAPPASRGGWYENRNR